MVFGFCIDSFGALFAGGAPSGTEKVCGRTISSSLPVPFILYSLCPIVADSPVYSVRGQDLVE